MTPDDEVRQVPQQLGNYTLLRRIGQGGFATVFLGQHIHLKSLVAVKILHASFGSMDRIDQFKREAQTIAELSHPNIVRVLDFDIQDSLAFFIMEYANFGSLRTQYKRGTVVPLPAVLSYVNQISSALYYAHQHRIIHRDVKPENMLVVRDKRILLSDFGIAALVADSSHMRTGEAVGTLAYMAPEQIQGKARLASDQYALAVSVYEWLCGEVPFQGTMTEIVAQHISTSPPPPSTYAPGLSYDVERVILKALAKDPTERFSSVQDFARALSKSAGVAPRDPEEERFVATTGAGRSSRSTVALPSAARRSSVARSSQRDLASVRTIRQPLQPSTGSQKSVQRKNLLSRRALLFGVVGLVGVGSVGVTIAALRQAPAAGPIQQSPVSMQPTTSQGGMSTMTPVTTPTTSTKKPTPDPAPTQPVSQQPPTPTQPVSQQPPAPTPTPPPLVPTGQLYVSYRGHSSVVFSVAWSPDGTRIASGGGDKTAQIWHASDGGMIANHIHGAAVTCVAWSPDSTRIASACDDKTVHVWNAITGNIIFVYTGHGSSVHSVAWSPDGKRVASSSTDRTVQVWDAVTGQHLMTYTNHAGTIWGVAWSPDGKRIASCSTDRTVRVWDTTTGITTTTYMSTDIVGNVAWSPDNKTIASSGNNNNVEIWDSRTGNLITSYIGHTGIAYGVSWSPDGRSIASAGADATVAVIDPMQGGARFIYRGHTSYVFGVTWAPNGKRIASGSDDRTVQVWF